jgi:hypothetical protein
MSTSTHRITIADAGYTNVSNGNLNCTVIAKTGTLLRLVIGGVEPAADTLTTSRSILGRWRPVGR